MRKTNKIIAFVLSALMLLSATPVFAASTGSVNNDKSIGEDAIQGAKTSYSDVGTGDYDTDVYLTIDDSNILVGIPTIAILNGKADNEGKNTGEYSVSAEGNMAGDKILVIEPESDNVTLHQTGKNDVNAAITQEQTEFTSSDLSKGTTADGKITTQGLTAGSWVGETSFNIRIKENTQVLYGKKIKTWDISNNKAVGDDVWMTYYDPSQIVDGIPIEKSIASSIKNLFTPMTTYAADEPGLTDIEQYTDGTVVITGEGASKPYIYYQFLNADKLIPAYEAYCYKMFDATSGQKTWITEAYKIINQNYKAISIEETHNMFSSNEEILKNCTVTHLLTFIKSTPDFWQEYASFFPEKIVIKDNVDTVGEFAFYGCTSIKNVEIGNIDIIGNNAFRSCENISELTIAEGVTAIEHHAFILCNNLTNVTIPNTLTNMGANAFESCENLTNVKIRDGATSIGENAFAGCSNLKTINIPASVTDFGKNAFEGCTKLTNLTLADGLTTIGIGAFRSCRNLESINIPSSVTNIGDYAFAWTGLTSVILPDGLINIGSLAFYGSSGLKTVNIPASVTAIGSSAFNSLASGSTIYCETQNVADLLTGKYTTSNTSVVVDSLRF